MKILNLYAGIGGNRKLWGDHHDITSVEIREDIANVYKYYFPDDTIIIGDAHEYLLKHYNEFDFIWASPPCQTHSRARFWAAKGGKTEVVYPDMKLYQEIIFLQKYCSCKWVVENVKPFYTPLITATQELGRHLFWSNFRIEKTIIKEADINRDTITFYKTFLGFDLSKFKLKTRSDQIYRNCVHPDTGLHILNCALNKVVSPFKQLLLSYD